jgi:hypothetical protein
VKIFLVFKAFDDFSNGATRLLVTTKEVFDEFRIIKAHIFIFDYLCGKSPLNIIIILVRKQASQGQWVRNFHI